MVDTPNKRAVVVGIFVLLGTAFLISGVLLVGNLRETFTTKIELNTLFDDVAGLQKGNNIWFSGVKIGTISNLEFYGHSQVKVTLAVDVKSQQYIRKDAKVKLSSDGFIGNKILIIYGGTEYAPAVEDGDMLIMEKTLGTEEILAMLQKNNENILAITSDFKYITQKISSGEGSIGKFLNDDKMYDDIKSSVSALKSTMGEAQKLVGSLNEISNSITKEGSLVNALATDTSIYPSIKTSVNELKELTVKANTLLAGINAATEDSTTSLGILLNDEASGSSLKETIKNLESSSATLDEDLKALQSNFLLKRYFRNKAKAAESE
ncbi:MAG: MlaD family protein [Prolixibacteraceae bacterium]